MGNRVPMKFVPDPHIPGAAEAGIGDLHFDDGTINFIEDPEMAGWVSQYPDSVDEINAAAAASGQPPMPPAEDFGGTPASAETAKEFQPIAQAPYVGRGYIPPAAGQPQPPAAAPPLDPMASAPTPVSAPLDTAVGMAPPPPSSPPLTGVGLMVTQRTGRLDPAVAAQQADARSASNIDQQLNLQTQRDVAFGAERADIRDKRLQLRAQMEEQQAQQQMAQQKVNRFKAEQRQVAEQDVTRDLVSAQGPGAILSVIGAALLGATGSDAGLRMIDQTIDRHVRAQMARKDSRLRVIADQLGNEEQAVQMAKSKYYEAAQKHAEQLQRLTQSDAYQKLTPTFVKELAAKQLQADQASERLSLGNPLETLPAGAAGVPPAQVEDYGKAAAAQDVVEERGLRVMRAIGGTGFDPKTKQIVNRKEILAELGGLPGVGRLKGHLPDEVVSQRGLEIRAALEGLKNAEAQAQNPGKAPTKDDIDAAGETLGLNTDEGIVKAVERLLGGVQETKDRNTATYGAGAKGAYDRTFQGQGAGQRPEGASPGQTRSATPADIEAERERRKQPGGGGPQAKADDVQGSIAAVAGKELPPEGQRILFAQAMHETGDLKSAPGSNFWGMKAVGDQSGQELGTTEGAGAEAKRTSAKFRTFASADESVGAMISLIKRQYPDAWTALQNGDENAYVAALKEGGPRKLAYFTADEGEYLKAIQRRL